VLPLEINVAVEFDFFRRNIQTRLYIPIYSCTNETLYVQICTLIIQR